MNLKPTSFLGRIGDDQHHIFRQIERIFVAMYYTNTEQVLFTIFWLEDHVGLWWKEYERHDEITLVEFMKKLWLAVMPTAMC